MSISPQVQASIISSVVSLIAGLLGGNWFSRHKQDARCERICTLMVNSFDKMLTALEVAGEPPELRLAIREARDSIVTAKNYLGIGGVSDFHYKEVN